MVGTRLHKRITPDLDPGLSAAIAEWRNWLADEKRASPHTLAAYRRDLDHFLIFLSEHLGGPPGLADLAALALDITRAPHTRVGPWEAILARVEEVGAALDGLRPWRAGRDPRSPCSRPIGPWLDGLRLRLTFS